MENNVVEKVVDSGIDWIGNVPAAWSKKRVSSVAKVINGYPFEADKFSLTDGYPLVRIRDITSKKTSVLYNGEFVESAGIESGDTLIGMDGDFDVAIWQGGNALLNQRVCCIRARSLISPRFLAYVLPVPLKIINSLTYATTVKHLSSSQIEKIVFYAPSISGQNKIAAYLDEKTVAIDEAITEKRRQVELLKEKRAVVIGNYVTKGLKKDTALVDSGSEWLGKVPAHWKMQRLKFFGRFVGGGTPKTDDRSLWEGDIPWVSSKDMKVPYLEDTEDHINIRAVRESATTVLPKGCLLMVFRSGILIHTIPAAVNTREMAINQDLKALIPSNGVSPRYLMYVILGFQQELLALWRKEGATVESLDLRQVTDTAFPLPSKEEQEAIADVLEAKTAMIDKAVAHIEKSIELLSEYRSSLITNIVTGKVTV